MASIFNSLFGGSKQGAINQQMNSSKNNIPTAPTITIQSEEESKKYALAVEARVYPLVQMDTDISPLSNELKHSSGSSVHSLEAENRDTIDRSSELTESSLWNDDTVVLTQSDRVHAAGIKMGIETITENAEALSLINPISEESVHEREMNVGCAGGDAEDSSVGDEECSAAGFSKCDHSPATTSSEDAVVKDDGSFLVPEPPSLKKTWRSGLKTMQSKLEFLITNENQYSDVIFYVGEEKKEIFAHRLILTLASPVFEELISTQSSLQQQQETSNNNKLQITIPDSEPFVFQELLYFIYTDVVQKSLLSNIDTAISVMCAAKKYKVPELVAHIGNSLKTKLTINNIIRVFELAEGELMGAAQNFIMANAIKIFPLNEFLNLSHAKLCKLLGNNALAMDELEVFESTLRWGQTKCRELALEDNAENLRQVLAGAIELIRFPLLSAQDFTLEVVPHGILTDKEQLELFKYFSVSKRAKANLIPQLTFNSNPREYTKIMAKIAAAAPVPQPIQKLTTKDKQLSKYASNTGINTHPFNALIDSHLSCSNPNLSNSTVAHFPALLQPSQYPLFQESGQSTSFAPLVTVVNPSPLLAQLPAVLSPHLYPSNTQTVNVAQGSKTDTSNIGPLTPNEKLIRSGITKDTDQLLGNLSASNLTESVLAFKKLQLCNNEGRVESFVKAFFRKMCERQGMAYEFARFLQAACQCNHQPTTRLRKQILDYSQQIFEKKSAYNNIVEQQQAKVDNAKNEDERRKHMNSLEVKLANQKRYYVCNLMFMAELYNINFFGHRVIVDAVNALLKVGHDESLESVCHLLQNCGEKLDVSLGGNPTNGNWMNLIFLELVHLFESKQLHFDVRLALIELIEVRQNGWKKLKAPCSVGAAMRQVSP